MGANFGAKFRAIRGTLPGELPMHFLRARSRADPQLVPPRAVCAIGSPTPRGARSNIVCGTTRWLCSRRIAAVSTFVCAGCVIEIGRGLRASGVVRCWFVWAGIGSIPDHSRIHL